MQAFAMLHQALSAAAMTATQISLLFSSQTPHAAADFQLSTATRHSRRR
jgi:hypothetical protein